jgi:hypothetical protein
MSEKPPSFTVTDRRKFTLEGDLRDESSTAAEETAPKPQIVEASRPAPVPEPVSEPVSDKGPRLVTMPGAVEQEDVTIDGDEPLPEPTARESAEQHAAYQKSSQQLDDMLRLSNPGMGPAVPVTIEHVIQSVYFSAVVAMGAAGEPGQKPRIDILGARQSIDMLTVLGEKTKGNLTEKEQRLLQSALFELRMMFLEITNAIVKQGLPQPPVKK